MPCTPLACAPQLFPVKGSPKGGRAHPQLELQSYSGRARGENRGAMSGPSASSLERGTSTGGATDRGALSESSGSVGGGGRAASEVEPPAPVDSPRSSAGAPGKAAQWLEAGLEALRAQGAGLAEDASGPAA
eukprot:2226204-Alexandrium_andersonii.AAC.1